MNDRGWVTRTAARALRVLAMGLAVAIASGVMTVFAADATAPAAPAAASSQTLIEAFVREGCPHCANAEAFLAKLGSERPHLRIVVRDVSKEPAALDRLKEIAQAQGGGAARVPAIFVGGELILGYSEDASTDKLILSALDGRARKPSASAPSADSAGSCEAEESLSCAAGPGDASASEQAFEITVFGRTLSLEDVGLPAFTLTMGLLDGFNPCSMWVLLLMISLLAPLNDRPRMVAIAGTFVLIQGIAYFVFMAAWLNLFLLIGLSRASELAIAAIAFVAGAINVKDFFRFGKGISLSIPEKSKPGIYSRMRGILHARSIAAAIIGTIVLGVLVQIVEFLCTSGFPALFTRILTLKALDTATYYSYILLYISAYMLDDLIILTIGVVMLSRHRLQEKEGRVLKLIAGVVMIGLGVYLAVPG
jgi:glutaredoxin